MSEARARGLGRGLSALLASDEPGTEAPVAAVTFAPISQLEANPDQPRARFDEDELNALAASIREKGVLQPILVRRNPRNHSGYEIIAGNGVGAPHSARACMTFRSSSGSFQTPRRWKSPSSRTFSVST